MKNQDLRIKTLNEVLNGIKVKKINKNFLKKKLKYIPKLKKVIKFYAWEIPFIKMISNIRFNEIVILKKIAYLNVVSNFSWTVAPFLVKRLKNLQNIEEKSLS